MDIGRVPYKVEFMIETYQGEWTPEDIANGKAPSPTIEKHAAWYENTSGDPVQITDEERIKELEASIQ